MSETIHEATIERPIAEAKRDAPQDTSRDRQRDPRASDRPNMPSPDYNAEDDYDPADDYRALPATAIATFVLGILSPLAFLDVWLAIIPMAAIVLGLVAVRQISRRSQEFTGKKLAVAGLVLSSVFLVAGGAYQAYIYANELPSADFVRASYSELQPYEGEPPNKIPPEAFALNGKKILIKGYVFPGQRQSGITHFLLVRDQGDCCFGGNPKVTDRILVTLNDPKGFDFSSKLFKVAGEFRISEQPVKAVDAEGAVFYHLVNAELR